MGWALVVVIPKVSNKEQITSRTSSHCDADLKTVRGFASNFVASFVILFFPLHSSALTLSPARLLTLTFLLKLLLMYHPDSRAWSALSLHVRWLFFTFPSSFLQRSLICDANMVKVSRNRMHAYAQFHWATENTHRKHTHKKPATTLTNNKLQTSTKVIK